ncbi:MAG: type II toxin-antitoxin system PemK/MazF family toxin [Candidatus Nomurabacteria bacterium]|jgi:mRNA interferase MazF|nr:type II toxin-antitoxin system PemK/MazF family toxin [Candidatus Nomurabacteria bacterium]
MKDYTKWTPIKAHLNNQNSIPAGYHESEIWLCHLGENMGFEQDGAGEKFVRPVLVLKIYNRSFCHVVPLSTTEKRDRFSYAFDGNTGKTSVALLTQSRPISSARLIRIIGSAGPADVQNIKDGIRRTLGL